jgi:hypothetical protein
MRTRFFLLERVLFFYEELFTSSVAIARVLLYAIFPIKKKLRQKALFF